MVVLGGVAVSYERGTPAQDNAVHEDGPELGPEHLVVRLVIYIFLDIRVRTLPPAVLFLERTLPFRWTLYF